MTPLPLRIAWRFLRSSPVQSALIAGGIATGIAAQVFVGSLITSLQDALVDQTIGSAPHITIQSVEEGEPVELDDRMERVIFDDAQVRQGGVAPLRRLDSLFSDESDSAPLSLIGGDLNEIDGIYRVRERTTGGKAALGMSDIMVGTDFAEKFGLSPGESVKLSLPDGRRLDLTVVGIFDLGNAAFNQRQAFVSGDTLRDVLGWSGNEYSQIQVQVVEPFSSAQVSTEWRRRLGGVEIVDWQAQNADLLTALQSQSSSSYMIQGFVLIAVALGIASTLAISAVQKTRQIGILKAMGMSDGAAARIFLFEALIIGGAGSVFGVMLGAAFVAAFALVPVAFVVRIAPESALFSVVVGLVVALASSVIPTRSISRLDPIEVIQGG